MTGHAVAIGGAGGAWGDSPMAIGQLLTSDVQYLMMDYLAEVTMSLLARARMKSPDAGFPPDFVAYLKPHLPEIARRGIKVVSNAGGVNPQACKKAIEALCAELGLCLRVAVVTGDELMPLIDQLRTEDVREWVSGATLPTRLLTANVYLGATPIAAALDQGADIVITGRCVDSALALGILMHEFQWGAQDYDHLAAGSLVGHILECGPQSVGGLFTDWESVPGWDTIGYPIARCHADGSFVLTKPEGTGGLVIPAAAAEQVLYEIADPAAYLLPDVVADFSHVRIVQEGENKVRISGARGRPAPATYKVSATFQDGYRAVALVSIVGTDAARKAERTADALVARARANFAQRQWADFTTVHREVLGAEASYNDFSLTRHTREVVLRLVVDHADARALDVFARELGSVGVSFAQGTTGLLGGRPKAAPVVKLFTFLVSRSRLAPALVQIGDAPAFPVALTAAVGPATAPDAPPNATRRDASPHNGHPGVDQPMAEVPLMRVAHARSGDKGNLSNVAIFCREPRYMAHLREVLTPERVAQHFAGSVAGKVVRYEAPGLQAFNFVMFEALGGGGMASPRIDPLGKAYGQRALEMMVPVPTAWGLA